MRHPWVRSCLRRCALLFFAASAAVTVGCAAGREVVFTTTPADAQLKIDDVETARAPPPSGFDSIAQTHKVLASRFGYADQVRTLSVDGASGKLVSTYNEANGREVQETTEADEIHITLPPQRKQVTINILPVPGWVALDGRPISTGPVSRVTRWVDFTVDAANHWLPHAVTVSHPGYADVTRSVEWTDPGPGVYDVTLQPLRKDLHITSRPPGAEIFVNGESRGTEPVTIRDFAFPVDPVTGQVKPQKITAKKAGFDPVERFIGWDDKRTDYAIDLSARSRTVRIATDPPGGVVTVNGTELPRDASGVSTAALSFAPVDDKGTMPVYVATASKKEGEREWESEPFRLDGNNDRKDYSLRMAEVTTRQVPMVRPWFHSPDGAWLVTVETVPTTAPRDVSEPAAARQAGVTVTLVFSLPVAGNGAGVGTRTASTIDSIATSSDGSQIVFTVLGIGADGQPHARLEILDLDGAEARPGPPEPGAPAAARSRGRQRDLAVPLRLAGRQARCCSAPTTTARRWASGPCPPTDRRRRCV